MKCILKWQSNNNHVLIKSLLSYLSSVLERLQLFVEKYDKIYIVNINIPSYIIISDGAGGREGGRESFTRLGRVWRPAVENFSVIIVS